MSFLKIKDPVKRERIVKEFLEIKKNICANELAEKTGKIELREDLSELFKPITETQKTTAREITEGLRPIKEGIEQLPQRLPRETRTVLKPIITILGKTFTPLTSKEDPKEEIRGVFEGSDTEFGIYDKGGEFFIGDKEIEEIKGIDGKWYYIIGKEPFKKSYVKTPGLEYLLTSKRIENIHDVPGNDIAAYAKILKETNTMYVDNDPESGELKPLKDDLDLLEKYSTIVEPTWSRMRGKKKRVAKKGQGLKKVVLPSDPNALLEKLDLLMASKAAGNTGLRNELVSVCDELKRQGIFDNKSYKKIMSLL